MATSHDGYLLPSGPGAKCHFISVAEECGQEDAVAVILLVGFLEAADWPLCEQNAGLDE